MLYKDFPVINKKRVNKKMICGVGINDSTYQPYVKCGDLNLICPIYAKWIAMIKRCYMATSLKYDPTYADCTVDERWHSFMAFREWILGQPEWEGLHLDKDLLVPGNKVYGPDTCLLVSIDVNNFLTFNQCTNSGLPIGVKKVRDRFLCQVKISDGSKVQWKSRSFETPEEAAGAYWTKKLEVAHKLASRQSNPVVAQAIIDHIEFYLRQHHDQNRISG